MLRIGDFSRLSRVSIKALRHYDELGLLRPAHVDTFTSYRYYDVGQLLRLYRILALKDLGLSLEAIGQLLHDDLPTAELRGMLRLRRAELQQRLADEAARLERIERLLRQIDQEGQMSTHDVVLKTLEPQTVASIRAVVPTPPDQGPLWATLMGALETEHVRVQGTPITVYHDTEYKERDWDVEVCAPVAAGTAVPGIAVAELPGHETAACVVYHGPLAGLPEAYDALARWISQNGYQAAGPTREVNLRVAGPIADQHTPDSVVEIQFPVARA